MDWGVGHEVVVRILLAVALGAVVGIERELADQPAGLRTHIAVATGAAVFGAISTLGFTEFDQPRADSTLQADVTRVASQVVVGVGFLGAGMIFRQGTVVRNLTTAASIWAVAAVGLAAGVGNLGLAWFTTVVLIAVLAALRPLRAPLHRRQDRFEVTVSVAPGQASGLAREMASRDVDITRLADGGDGATVGLRGRGGSTELAELLDELSGRPDVVSIDGSPIDAG
jgi:putative Mg2+ transporter-C (MgtC) family protein